MKNHLFGALAALALTASVTPAAAQETVASNFSGARVGMNIGVGGDDITDFDGATVGVELGYDWDLGSSVAGISAEYQTDLNDDFLDVNESALLGRFGAKVGANTLIYVNGGLTRVSTGSTPFGGIKEDGIRGGVGAEFAFGGTSLKIEQRYLDYGNGVNIWQTVAGVGFRF